MIPLPDPPLRSGSLLLRPWGLDDAPALVAAWADPDIQRWTGVPHGRDHAAAERWIAGDAGRRARGLSLDLVVERDGAVVGEVGLAAFDRTAHTAEGGWWTAPAHRGHGIASSATRLLVDWALPALELHAVVARCDPANPASIAVALAAGLEVVETTAGEVRLRTRGRLCPMESAGPSEDIVSDLLDALCRDQGHCLSTPVRQRLIADPPATVDGFTDAVLAAAGLDPVLHSHLRHNVRVYVARSFAGRPSQ